MQKKNNRKRNIAIGASIAGSLGALGTGLYFLRKSRLGKVHKVKRPSPSPPQSSQPSITSYTVRSTKIKDPTFKRGQNKEDNSLIVALRQRTLGDILEQRPLTNLIDILMDVNKLKPNNKGNNFQKALSISTRQATDEAIRRGIYLSRNLRPLNFNMYRSNKFRF